MSLLSWTINYFFANRKQCAFIGEQWFIENPVIQLDVLKICWAGLAKMIKTSADEQTFVDCITDVILYDLPEHFSGISFLKLIGKNIANMDVLLYQPWFLNSPQLQIDIAVAACNDIGFNIDIYCPNMHVNLQQAMKQYYEFYCFELDDLDEYECEDEDIDIANFVKYFTDVDDVNDDVENYDDVNDVENVDDVNDEWNKYMYVNMQKLLNERKAVASEPSAKKLKIIVEDFMEIDDGNGDENDDDENDDENDENDENEIEYVVETGKNMFKIIRNEWGMSAEPPAKKLKTIKEVDDILED
jgi:hypothetical protein